MAYIHDIVFSTRDAEALARLLANHRRAHPFEADGSDALADLMLDARFVPDEAMPDGYVGLHSRVTYAEERGAPLRTVVLVAPEDADAGMGRVSVLTPIGLALVGRCAGALTEAALPNGRTLKLRVLDAARPRAPVEPAASASEAPAGRPRL